MELLFELLLTAAATLLVAVLLAKLFSSAAANTDPRHHDRGAAGPADVIIAEEKVEEEERIIEVDEVKARGAAAAPAPTLSEGWVEVEKAPAAVAAEGKKAAWVAVEEGLPAALAPELFLGTVLEERKEEGEVGKKPRDLLTSAAEVAGEGLGDEAAPREVLHLELQEEMTLFHSGAEFYPSEALDAELQKQQVQPTEAAVMEQRHLGVVGAAPAEAIDAGLEEEEEEGAQAVEVIPRELASETVPDAVLDVVLEKQQVVQVNQHELAAEVAPIATPDKVARELAAEVAAREIPNEVARELASEVAPRAIPDEVARELASEVAPRAIPDEVAREFVSEVASRTITNEVARELAAEVDSKAIPSVVVTEEEELKEQSVEEVVDQHEEVQDKEEAQCELGPVDQQEKLVPEEELVVMKADDLNVSQEDTSNDKVAVQLPDKEATLLAMPEDEARANMEFEEWEGIERSEVEKRFGVAAAFAASDAGAAALSKLDSDVQLQLQGLLKVAIDGPCYDSAQPLTLRPSSRAKWVSWQKLGNMHPEIAMEKYMDLLSEFIPRWIGDKTSSTKKHEGDVDSEGAALTMTAHTSDPQTNQGNEGSTSIDEGPLTSPPNPEKGQSIAAE